MPARHSGHWARPASRSSMATSTGRRQEGHSTAVFMVAWKLARRMGWRRYKIARETAWGFPRRCPPPPDMVTGV